jgi:hypothetical protein
MKSIPNSQNIRKISIKYPEKKNSQNSSFELLLNTKSGFQTCHTKGHKNVQIRMGRVDFPSLLLFPAHLFVLK